MKTKLLCYLGALLLLSGLFCSCEKEPEASVFYYTEYCISSSETRVWSLSDQQIIHLRDLYLQFNDDLRRLSERHKWEKTATKGNLPVGDEDAIAEFDNRLLPEVEELISTYQEKINALGFPDGDYFRLKILCTLYKEIKIADIVRHYSSYIAEHEFELKTN